ncbi:hypothetical protein K6025_00160 [Ehrlichia sp. JZT12]
MICCNIETANFSYIGAHFAKDIDASYEYSYSSDALDSAKEEVEFFFD